MPSPRPALALLRSLPGTRPGLVLGLILALATVTRLYHLNRPMADNLQGKQVYVANKARAIAGPPFDVLADRLDFLDESGRRIELIEEVPLYTGLLGLGYRLFGERDAVGHLLSLLGSLVAIAAFFDLARREHGDTRATVATLLLSMAPLFVFYGRAVLPDPWMLAAMLAAAAAYRRFLDGDGARWLVAAMIAGVLAGAFKYFGLMVVLPLAEMTLRARGLRGLVGAPFVALVTAMVAPIAVWMLFVFVQAPNPVQSGWSGTGTRDVMPYLIVQAPELLFDRRLYAGLARFLVRDCGPITALLMLAGGLAVAARRVAIGPVAAWTAMGLLFYGLLGPKLIDHDYYELMMLPAAALWAAAGWSALAQRPRLARLGVPALVLGLAVVVQSPWVSGGMFRVEAAKLTLAESLRIACPPGGRVVVMGPGLALSTVVHYTGREGWAVRTRELPPDWPARLARYRAQGAEYVALYFDPKTTTAQRATFAPLLAALPRVARDATGRTESLVLRLGPAEATALAAMPAAGSDTRR